MRGAYNFVRISIAHRLITVVLSGALPRTTTHRSPILVGGEGWTSITFLARCFPNVSDGMFET